MSIYVNVMNMSRYSYKNNFRFDSQNLEDEDDFVKKSHRIKISYMKTSLPSMEDP